MHTGGGERPGGGHPLHLQRSPGVSHLLAHLQHHGGEPVRWKVLLLLQHDVRRNIPSFRGQQQERVLGACGGRL